MLRISEIKIPVGSALTLAEAVSKRLCVPEDKIKDIRILKKSIDARRADSVCHVYSAAVSVKNESALLKRKIKNVSEYKPAEYEFPYKSVISNVRPIIIGSGPAGLFCALMLSRIGLKPIVAERGESVENREKTIESFWNGGALNENSNVQFGEGGAGTFSDGKLTCGVNDKRMQFIRDEFVRHGAPEEISYASKAHIGTDNLKNVVRGIREEIVSNGGEIRFNTLLCDVGVYRGAVESVTLKDLESGQESKIACSLLVVAAGHSSRDTYEMLLKRGVSMVKKPFSVGVRIEHKREFINKIQYKDDFLAESLPAADYKLSCHPDGRGVYTFCMCPGGVVVAGASEKGGVVTNGMSLYARNDENSNSALLVSVSPEDIEGESPLCAVDFQRKIERAAFECGGGNFFAPCQTVGDFLRGVPSEGCASVKPSYLPGVRYTDLADCLPDFVVNQLKKALPELNKKMHGFCLDDALLTGVETRSSAPVRIVRGDDMVSNVRGLYPIGEGAGYAGGIMSSAADGIKCAEKIAALLKNE